MIILCYVLLHASILSKSSFAVLNPQQPVTKVIYIFYIYKTLSSSNQSNISHFNSV